MHNILNPFFPRDNFVHDTKKLFTLCRALPQAVFEFAYGGMLHADSLQWMEMQSINSSICRSPMEDEIKKKQDEISASLKYVAQTFNPTSPNAEEPEMTSEPGCDAAFNSAKAAGQMRGRFMG
jgi:hypothetical protein